MRQKNSYFGSIFERSKTLDLPRPVHSYVLPQLNDQMNRKANAGLKPSVTDAVNIDESSDNPVSSRYTGLLSEKNTSTQESASSLETVHRSSKTGEPVLETATEASGEDITGKSNNKGESAEPPKEESSSIPALRVKGNISEIKDSVSVPTVPEDNITGGSNNRIEPTELLKEESSSIPALRAKENIPQIRDSVSVPTVPEENIKGKSSFRDESINGEKEDRSSANFQSSYPAYRSEKSPNNQFTGTHQSKVASLIQEPVRSYSFIPASSDHGLHDRQYSGNNAMNRTSDKSEEVDISNRKKGEQHVELHREEIKTASHMKTNRHDASGSLSFTNILKTLPINKEVPEKETPKIEANFIYPAAVQTDHRSANKIPYAPQYEKKKDEPSLVIKKIDIQIVDNRRQHTEQVKRTDHLESDVLGRSYLWRFNIS